MEGVRSQPVKSSEPVISEGGKHLSIVYFNARSLVHKLDKLCVLIETCKPHIICIVETWLCSDIMDNEVTIPGFQLHRLDRNRHGGGILMHISDKLTMCHLPAIVQDHNLEFLPLSVRFLEHKFCIAAFFIDPQVLHPSNILIHCFTLLNALIYHSF